MIRKVAIPTTENYDEDIDAFATALAEGRVSFDQNDTLVAYDQETVSQCYQRAVWQVANGRRRNLESAFSDELIRKEFDPDTIDTILDTYVA